MTAYTHLYALINNSGVHRIQKNQALQIDELKRLVSAGDEDTIATELESSHEDFSDSEIDLVYNADFGELDLPVTCLTTKKSIPLCGQIVACICSNHEILGLTEQQFQIIVDELTVISQ